MNADPIRQMSKRNEHNMLSLMRIKEYALLTIRYANEGMLDNKQIREILCSKDLEESEKARKVLALFENAKSTANSIRTPNAIRTASLRQTCCVDSSRSENWLSV